MVFDQAEFDIRCEWGEHGVTALAPISDVVVIVDVLSYSTCVEVAASRGAVVYPYRHRDETAAAFAREVGAELAVGRGQGRYSLSPGSLQDIPDGARVVLPSPNGATLTMTTGSTPTLAGCLRNCEAVARAASRYGTRVAVIPAGERWQADGSLRPCFEDWLGAGAIVEYLDGTLSPEAAAARAAYRAFRDDLPKMLRECNSGKELIAKGYADDVDIAAELNCSNTVPVLKDGAYIAS